MSLPGNLDTKNSLEIMKILSSIAQERLVILVTHEEKLANDFATRIIHIKDGKIVKDYKNENPTINEKIYDINKILNTGGNLKYSSINNIFRAFLNGIRKIANYSLLKKVLMSGFTISAMFILFAICNIAGNLDIKDSKFITADKGYLEVESKIVSVEDFINYEKVDGVDYILPGNANVTFKFKFNDYYQTLDYLFGLSGCLASLDYVSDDELIIGRLPENEYEIIVDKMVYDNLLKNEESGIKFMGVTGEKDLLNRKVFVDNMKEFTIVGFSDKGAPSIYANKKMFISILKNSNPKDIMENRGIMNEFFWTDTPNKVEIEDYNLYLDDITITKGRLPENDYEVIINQTNKDDAELNKTISEKVNDKKLTVVGYYDSKSNNQKCLVNNNTLKYNLINYNAGMMIYPIDEEKVLTSLRNNYNLNVNNKYEIDRNNYINKQKSNISNFICFSTIILLVSLIEMFFISRATFLSRIKEIGILRIIGVKKKDIYKIFLGEILAITTCISLVGIVLMGYIINILIKIPALEEMFILNVNTVGLSILLIYTFNILVGLIPIYKLLRKTPINILGKNI